MNLHNISMNQVVAWIVILLGLVFAAWVGTAVAEGQMTVLIGILAAVLGITAALSTGRHFWLLIPLCWPLTGSI
jgi:Mg2+/Co2+ transporter CorB